MKSARVLGWLLVFIVFAGAESEEIDQTIAALMRTINFENIPQDRPDLAEVKVERVRTTDEELLKRFMGADARKTQESPEVRVYEDKEGRLLQVFSHGGFAFTYPADPKELVAKKMTLGEARTIAEAFLEQNGGLPEGAYEYKSGEVSQGITEGAAVIYYFTYAHKLFGVPVEYDNITVSVGASRVLEYIFGWSKLVTPEGKAAAKAQKVIPAMNAVQKALAFQYERVLGGKSYQPVRVEGATLVYTLKTKGDYTVLAPAWKVTLSMESRVAPTSAGEAPPAQKAKFLQNIRVHALTGDVIVQ